MDAAIRVQTLLIIGFSLFAVAILLLAYLFFLPNMQKTAAGKLACAVLLAALAGLQSYHFAYLLFGAGDLFDHRPYVVLLLSAPPAFYFFSRELLLPDPGWSASQLLHAIPVVLSFLLPVDIVVPIAFTIGAGYSIWFARIVYGMRRHVGRFHFEMFFFGLFAILAVLVLVFFVLVPYLDASVFYIAYANFTGVALFLIVAALIVFPEMLDNITDVARITYAKSTLDDIDIVAKVRELEEAMSVDKLYQNEDPNLKMVAEAVGAVRAPVIGAHQHPLRQRVFALRTRATDHRGQAPAARGQRRLDPVDRHGNGLSLAVEFLRRFSGHRGDVTRAIPRLS